MARRGDVYLAGLVDELSNPRAYEMLSMQASVKEAIGRIAGRLAGGQLSRILGAIMASNRPEDVLEASSQSEGLLRAQLLADTPNGMFTAEEIDHVLAALGSQLSAGDKLKAAGLRSGRTRAQFLAEVSGGEAGRRPPGARQGPPPARRRRSRPQPAASAAGHVVSTTCRTPRRPGRAPKRPYAP